jgi:tRNA modification GTPase
MFVGKIPRNSAIVVINKADVSSKEQIDEIRKTSEHLPVVVTSAKLGIGISELERRISDFVIHPTPIATGESVIINNLRQRGNLEQARSSVNLVLRGIEEGNSPELLAVDLRAALTHLSEVVGVDISEEVLNNVFSRFCIGK